MCYLHNSAMHTVQSSPGDSTASDRNNKWPRVNMFAHFEHYGIHPNFRPHQREDQSRQSETVWYGEEYLWFSKANSVENRFVVVCCHFVLDFSIPKGGWLEAEIENSRNQTILSDKNICRSKHQICEHNSGKTANWSEIHILRFPEEGFEMHLRKVCFHGIPVLMLHQAFLSKLFPQNKMEKNNFQETW